MHLPANGHNFDHAFRFVKVEENPYAVHAQFVARERVRAKPLSVPRLDFWMMRELLLNRVQQSRLMGFVKPTPVFPGIIGETHGERAAEFTKAANKVNIAGYRRSLV